MANASLLYLHWDSGRPMETFMGARMHTRTHRHTHTHKRARALIVSRTDALKGNSVLNYQTSIYAYKLDCVTDTFSFGAQSSANRNTFRSTVNCGALGYNVILKRKKENQKKDKTWMTRRRLRLRAQQNKTKNRAVGSWWASALQAHQIHASGLLNITWLHHKLTMIIAVFRVA